MHTGDLAAIDDDGYCNIVGRVKDMIIRGGENVYPREIEEFLYRHAKVKEVQVFGVPDRSTARRSAPGSSRKPATRSPRGESRVLSAGPDSPLQDAALFSFQRPNCR